MTRKSRNSFVKIRPLSIVGNDVMLSGAAFIPGTPNNKVIIFCHGLPKGLPCRDDNDPGYPGLARFFAAKGFSCVIFNFRGTGESSGSLEVAKWPDDLISVMDFLDKEKELCSEKYMVVGFSTGATAAIFAGSKDIRIGPLVLCAAVADFSILDIEKNRELYFSHYKKTGMIKPDYPFGPKEWADNFKQLEGKKAMADLLAKRVMILHGLDDDTVPPDHANILCQLCPIKPALVMFKSKGHHLRRDENVIRMIRKYLLSSC